MAGVVEELENIADLCSRIRLTSDPAALVSDLLAPVASFLAAETASFRSLSLRQGAPRPEAVVSLGIPQSVDDAYLDRYFKLDPARRLLRRRFSKPLFAHPTREGEWSIEQTSAAEREQYRAEFLRYRKEFLLPNDFCHHVGFCFQDRGRTLLFDFHRPARASAFDKLDKARAKILAMFLHAELRRSQPVEALQCVGGMHELLSARELEVAEAVARGLSNKEVAASLDISVRTVENHMRSIFAKLDVTTRTRLAAKLHEGAVRNRADTSRRLV